jgi:hypothetical protein
MRYVMFTYPDADFAATYEQLPPEEIEADVARHMAWFQKHRAHIDGGEELGFPREARTLRRRGGRVTITDGPFVETKEIICGFDLIECRDLDEAIEVARKHPMATYGMVEVRPFWTPPPPS